MPLVRTNVSFVLHVTSHTTKLKDNKELRCPKLHLNFEFYEIYANGLQNVVVVVAVVFCHVIMRACCDGNPGCGGCSDGDPGCGDCCDGDPGCGG